MTEQAPNRASASSSRPQEGLDWAHLKPQSVDFEDAMSQVDTAATWVRMYSFAGLRSPNEMQQAAFRLAVYVYMAKNGSSREGSYSGKITTADGRTFDASSIPRATGKMNIRKFMRGNMNESYTALKESKALAEDERFVAKVAALGATKDDAFAVADWLTDCPLFTPAEARLHNKAFTIGISRARRAREGNSLERVEDERIMNDLKSQGRFDSLANNDKVEF